MELAVAVLSLMWVIGILTLQRLDSTIDEFVKADAYYLSLDQAGVINQTQLSVKSLLPATTIRQLTQQLAASPQRWDRGGLKKSLRFYKISSVIKYSFELLLVTITLILPVVYLVDFSGYQLPAIANKNACTYLLFLSAVVASLIAQKLLVRYSARLYPLNITVASEQ